ncbi:MAG TPA: hypothetical protein VFK05_15870 [Polyangiaceae bacterium]|nr:hypothetical protein [Polyangiaceae bacterium]
MACEIVTTLGAVFALWGEPELSDVERIQGAVQAAVAACGHPVVYVTRVPVGAPAPNAQVRARLDQAMPELLKLCSTYHAVLEGEGFAAAMKRGVLTGMFQLSWRRKTFFVHAKMSEIAGSVPLAQRAAVAHLLETAKMRGLLEASES